MDQGSIQQWALIDTGLAMLTQWCPLTADLNAQITQNVQKTLVEIGLTLTKDSAAEYYKAYQQRHEAAATYTNLSQYCGYKIAAYQIQKRFYLVSQGKAVAINPVRTSETYRTKYFAALKNLNHYIVPTTIEPHLKISVNNRAEVTKLHPTTKRVANEMSALYRGIIGTSLKKLQTSTILTQDDIKLIWPKITFTYVNECSELRGLTKVMISRIGERNVGTSLVSINFNVNLCEDMSYLSGFDKHIIDLSYHELAHYIYYIKDTTKTNFESICRNGTKNTCKKSDFVSDYSLTSPEEDYAETFQFWYQSKIKPKPWSKLSKKFSYFEKTIGTGKIAIS